ncbi:hypothetical protein D3C73_1101990 [compost metagenome]
MCHVGIEILDPGLQRHVRFASEKLSSPLLLAAFYDLCLILVALFFGARFDPFVGFEVALEVQADVQGLAARRHQPAPGRHAQGIVVIRLQLTLAPVILIDLRDVTRQTSLDRKRWRVPHRSVFHFGHDWGSGNCSGVLIGYSGLP